MTMVPFTDAKDRADKFIALLSQEGIDPPSNSPIENELLSLTELLDIPMRDQSEVSDLHKIGILRASAGVHDFAAKVLSTVKDGRVPETFRPHLRMIATSPKFAALMGQNYKGTYNDDLGRKFIELYIACCLTHFASELSLDHPTSSRGDNPDIIFRPNLANVKPDLWTIAVKTLGSTKGRTVFENIQKAGEQINSSLCKADKGLVLLNTRDVLAHDILWRPQTPFPNLNAAINAQQSLLHDLQQNFTKDLPTDEWCNAVGGKVRQPVLVLAHTLVSLPLDKTDSRIATQLKSLATVDFHGDFDPEAISIAGALNDHVQCIL